jgi:hypothetical protein
MISASPDAIFQTTVREWVDLRKWGNPYAVTLTFKQSMPNDMLPGHTLRLEQQIAQQNFGYFMHLFNESLFGNLAKRHRMKVNVFAILEGSCTKHLHYHAAIDCPKHVTDEQFRQKINTCWSKTWWGNKQVHIVNSANNGWVKYMTKFRDKEIYQESVDWINSNF